MAGDAPLGRSSAMIGWAVCALAAELRAVGIGLVTLGPRRPRNAKNQVIGDRALADRAEDALIWAMRSCEPAAAGVAARGNFSPGTGRRAFARNCAHPKWGPIGSPQSSWSPSGPRCRVGRHDGGPSSCPHWIRIGLRHSAECVTRLLGKILVSGVVFRTIWAESGDAAVSRIRGSRCDLAGCDAVLLCNSSARPRWVSRGGDCAAESGC
jgi:hypothetical protein